MALKGLNSKMIADLNKSFGGGVFFEGLIVVRNPLVDPPVIDYFCNYQRPIQFEGNVYVVEGMLFDDGFGTSSTMELQVAKINFVNIGGVVDSYLHDPTVKIRRNKVIMQILHMDEQGVVIEYDRDELQIKVVHGASGKGTATMFAGIDMRLDDKVPRGTIENNEFPGIRADITRAG